MRVMNDDCEERQPRHSCRPLPKSVRCSLFSVCQVKNYKLMAQKEGKKTLFLVTNCQCRFAALCFLTVFVHVFVRTIGHVSQTKITVTSYPGY